MDGDDIHLLDYVRVLYKRRWVAVTSFLVVVLSVVTHNFTAMPVYEAKVQILIEGEDPNVISFQEVLEENQRTNEYYQTQYRILQSRTLARRTLDRLHAWTHPELASSPVNSRSAWSVTSVVGYPIGVATEWLRAWRAPQPAADPPAADESAAQSATIDRLMGRLTVAPVENSRLVEIRYRSGSPAFAAEVANALARTYIEQNLEYKFQSSKEATDWLAQQMAEQRDQMEGSERALQQYRELNDAVSLEDRQNIVVQKLTDLNAAVTRARTERIQKEAAYSQIRNVQNNRVGLDTLPAIVSNAFIQQQKAQLAELQRQQAELSERLLPRHPEMVKLGLAIEAAKGRIDAEIAKVVESLRNDYQQALAQEQTLDVALDQQKREALNLDRKGIEYGVLARNVAADRQVFESLMQRLKETGVSGQLKTSNVRIVDAAEVPRAPASPQKGRNLWLGLAFGSMLAVGLVFFFEYLDNRIKNPDEIERYLRLACFAMVPAVPRTADSRPAAEQAASPLVCNGVPQDFSESFRVLRTSMIFSSTDPARRNVVVTSTAPGEGKTVIAANLAVALAVAGERVLLIDADMRKSRVHEVFGKPQQPGLSNLLVGAGKGGRCLHRTSVPGLWIMPAGKYSPNPSELLSSKRCQTVFRRLKEQFDWVIIDSPPIMSATDAVVLAQGATVLFVVGSEMVARGLARRAVSQLVQNNAKVLGAVLNRVELERNGYYYSPYYRREYADYYQNTGT